MSAYCYYYYCYDVAAGKGVYLRREDDEGYANHDDHVQLGRPDIRHEVAVTDGGKRDHHVVRGLKQAQVTVTGSLEVLYPAHAGNKKVKKKKKNANR